MALSKVFPSLVQEIPLTTKPLGRAQLTEDITMHHLPNFDPAAQDKETPPTPWRDENFHSDMASSDEDDRTQEPLLNQLLEANRLELAGEFDAARALYEEIMALNAASPWGASAKKALQSLPSSESSSPSFTGGQNGRPPQDPISPPESDSRLAVLDPQPDPHPMERWKWLLERWDRLSVGLKLKLMLMAATLLPLGATAMALVVFSPPKSAPQSPLPQSAPPAELELAKQRSHSLVVGLTVALLMTIVINIAISSLERTLQAVVKFAHVLSQGNTEIRLEIGERGDEVGTLARNLWDIAERLEQNRENIQTIEEQRHRETQQQTQEKEQLQKQVMELLLQIEGARTGDLTVRAPTVAGEVGAIADAFNATIGSLKQLVTQVKTVTETVTQRAQGSEASVLEFSQAALTQSEKLDRALESVVDISESIQRVSQSTQEAAAIARKATKSAQLGDRAMDRTVASMEKIRSGVSNTAKKAKRLAEASQEVSQILVSISGISEKANLLAFNASIEAARAGDQGQGFRQVADEVRGLAAQVSESAQDVEQLIDSIQEETANVLNVLELSTAEVVAGTGLVSQTQKTLQTLTRLSQQIDRYLEDVAANTIAQAQGSKSVNQTMDSVAKIALSTAHNAQNVVSELQELVGEVETLQTSVEKFQVRSNDEP